MRWLCPALLLLCALGSPVVSAAPALVPDAAQQAALDNREAVLQWKGDWLTSAIDSTASADALFAATLDLKARVGEVEGVESIELYDVSSAGFGATWSMAITLYRASFHILYKVDRAGRSAAFTIDPSKENDIVLSEGRLWVEALPGGGSRLNLSGHSESGGWAPGLLVRRMSEKNAAQTLEGSRARAEAASP